MKLIILITSDTESGMEVANRWQEVGAPGVTIIKSVGLQSLKRKIASDSLEVPLHFASSVNSVMAYMLRQFENTNHVLLSVVPAALVHTLLDEARAVMGDLMEPNHGVAFVVPLDEAIGVRAHENSADDAG